jgi:cytochrome c oxidase subunit 2
MPAFGGRIAEHQAWRIVAYVRSLSGLHKRDSDYAGQVQTLPSKAVSRTEAPLARRGQEVFLNGPCAMCHTIRGTLAGGRTGPDLTHVASRRMLAAGTLANTPGYLVRWIVNPQNLKPGTKMPPTRLPTADLHALVAFLGSLK